MNIDQTRIKELQGLLATAKKIVILGHMNPDGDALGSSLALQNVLVDRGYETSVIVPNRMPSFLEWLPGADGITTFREKPQQVEALLAQADLIFCMDFNQVTRLEGMSHLIEASAAPKVLIDHHIDPPEGFAVSFSDTASCSTCFLLLQILEALYGNEHISRGAAELIYVGIMTDTGNFSFSHLTPELFRSVATLVEKGINIPELNSRVYNNFSASRMALLGYSLYSKMEVMQQLGVAYISLTEEELRRFKFKMGDSEGFVNYPLSINGIFMSALFIQNKEQIRISIRSRGDVDVNLFARRYFNGGGHKNAAGGRSTDSLEQTIERFRVAVKEYLGETKVQ